MVKPGSRKLTRDVGDPEKGSFGCCGGGKCDLSLLIPVQKKIACVHVAEEHVFWPCALLAVYQLSGASVSSMIFLSLMSFGAGMIWTHV